MYVCVCVCVCIYIYIVFSPKLWYMLLGMGFEFLFRIRRVLRDAKDRIYICSVSPCDDLYHIFSVNFYKIATMSIIVVLG